jgi:hypothetical protein
MVSMRFLLSCVIISSIISCYSFDMEGYCIGHTAEEAVVIFQGVSGDFYMKEKVVERIDEATFDQICSELDNFTPTWTGGRGSDYRIRFFLRSLEGSTLINLFQNSSSEPRYTFGIGLKYYTNDQLARLLIELVDVEEVRTSDEYIIDSW